MIVDVSIGEVIDKITILQIKSEKFNDEDKRKNVNTELNLLSSLLPSDDRISKYISALKEVNERLWEIEDDIRLCEKDDKFDEAFIELARSVYKTNDIRASIKKQINVEFNSEIIEEKGYEQY
jgi:hypothetical protein